MIFQELLTEKLEEAFMVLKKKKIKMVTYSSLFFLFFSSLCILSSIFVIFSKNPIFSILFLIFTFACVSCVLFLFNFEFIPISFIVIYVGAIAVLFLFVLMMLNIKLAELAENKTYYLPFSIIFFIFLMIELLFILKFEYTNLNIYQKGSGLFLIEYLNIFTTKTNFLNYCQLFSNIEVISFTLFNNYLYCFYLSSLVLLLAMVGAITQTLKKQ
jgi:NADH-quinone oxidoreductase subunit J